MLYLLLLIAGFAPLIFGANFLVDGASSLAKRFNIPLIVIGLTIVAFGTSAPELVVNVFASADKNPDIALGNVIGSNIFNVLGILGVSAIIYPLTVKTKTTWIEIPLCFLSALVALVLANDGIIDRQGFSHITRIDGIILLFFFIIFLAYNLQLAKSGSFGEEMAIKDYKPIIAVLLVILGLGMLVGGGRLIVFSAVKFASQLGISERIIALTIVSIGTSLPELATSAVAARKKNVDIAIGNIVGSNIFNSFFILGISAVIYPVTPQPKSNFDLLVNIGASLLLFVFVFTGKGRRIDRWEGFLFLALYAGYVTTLILT